MKRIFLSLGVLTLLFSLCSCDTYVGGYAGGPGYRPGYARPSYYGYRSGFSPRYAWNAPAPTYYRPSYPRTYSSYPRTYSSPRTYYRSSGYRSSSYRDHDRDHHHQYRSSSWNGARTDARVNAGPLNVRSNTWLGL